MFCNNCGAELSENSKFCSECGHKIEKKALNIGDKNVIAGDVYGSKEDFHISGNATFINKDDDTSKICACTNCGKHILLLSGFTCTKCQKFVCSSCYNKKHKVCENCAIEIQKENKNQQTSMQNIEHLIKEKLANCNSKEDFAKLAQQFLQKEFSDSFDSLKRRSNLQFSHEMIFVEEEKSEDDDENEKKFNFYMGEHPVTQKEYEEVMGENPSIFENCPENPVDSVSFYKAVIFCNKLSIKDGLIPCYSLNGTKNPNNWEAIPSTWEEIGKTSWIDLECDFLANGYRIPTTHEWFLAANDGIANEMKTSYSGDSNFENVGWFSSNSGNSTQPVCQKNPNELGFYDMSGNINEWCWDRPDHCNSGVRYYKGGSFADSPAWYEINIVDKEDACAESPNIGFRICATDIECEKCEKDFDDVQFDFEPKNSEENNSNYSDEEIDFSEQFYLCADEDYDDEVFSEENAKIVLQNIENRMVLVEGGTMKLGNPDFHCDNPVHTATIKDFYISQVTVTQKLFRFIMGTDKIHYYQEQFGDDLPMEFVGYYDAVAFCNVLSRLAGLEPVYSVRGKTNPADWKGYEFPEEEINIDYRGDFKVIVNRNANGYRLPDGDENEFAYRGGTKSRNFRYAGSNRLEKIAWFDENSNNEMHEVGLKMPNELGLYDMTGNVAELCNDAIIKSGKYNDGYKGGAIESFCRSADCYSRYYGVGFRIARNR